MSKIHGFGIVAAALLSMSSLALGKANVIYGEDDRRDLFDSKNDPRLVELARSTAIVMHKEDITRYESATRVKIPTETFGESQNLCKDEPFFDQPTPGFCSGFLVSDDILVTAGHCIANQAACDGTAFVFDYGFDHQGKDLSKVDVDDVYYCKTIVARRQESGVGQDYAVVKIDRSVVGRSPLKLRRSGAIAKGDDVTVVGHPSGLPTKITGGATVRANDSGLPYFVANTDSYGGNSGSAVFNNTTGEVEGILVRGETDFISRNGCMASNKCASGACRGEDVTKASVFMNYIPTN